MKLRVFGVQVVNRGGNRRVILWGRSPKGNKVVVDTAALPREGSLRDGILTVTPELLGKALTSSPSSD